jgi:hypothetical protein
LNDLVQGCISEPLPSWPGLARPPTRRRLNDKFDIGLAGGKRLYEQSFSVLIALRTSVQRVKHVDGRAKPGHDASQRPSLPLPTQQQLSLQGPYCRRQKLPILCQAPDGRFRGLLVVISDTSLNPQLDGKSLNLVLSEVSP